MMTFNPLWQEGLDLAQYHCQQQDYGWGFAPQQYAPLAVTEPWAALSVRR